MELCQEGFVKKRVNYDEPFERVKTQPEYTEFKILPFDDGWPGYDEEGFILGKNQDFK